MLSSKSYEPVLIVLLPWPVAVQRRRRTGLELGGAGHDNRLAVFVDGKRKVERATDAAQSR